MKKLIAAVIALAGVFVAVPAAACTIQAPQEHSVVDEPAPDDVPPPETPDVTVESITRGQGPSGGIFNRSSTSCDGLGFLEFKISPARQEVGYTFDVVEGAPPDDYSFPDVPTHTNREGSIWFEAWSDGAEDKQESFRFETKVTAIDKWGRKSEPSEPVVVSHPGTGPCGGGSGSNQAALIVFSLSVLGLFRERISNIRSLACRSKPSD